MSELQLRSHLLIPEGMGEKRALIVGAGTVSSNVAMALAAIGVRDFTIYDYDTVGIHNLPSQHFTAAQVGHNKAEALADNLLARYAVDGGLLLNPDIGKFTPSAEGKGTFDIIVSGADSMTVRKMVSMWARGSDARLIDTRCGGHEIQTWAYDTADAEQYETYRTTLYSDSDADPLPCGGEMYPVAGLAASIATLAAVSTTGWFYRLADTQLGTITG